MPTTTAVFRAVADFAELNREVRKTRKDLAALQAQAADTSGWDSFGSALDKLTAQSEKLSAAQRDQAQAAKQARGEQTKFAQSLTRVSAATKPAADATQRLNRAQRSSATASRQATAGSRDLNAALRKLTAAEQKASTAQQRTTETSRSQAAAMRSKASASGGLTRALRRTADAEAAAALGASSHASALGRESSSASTASSANDRLGVATARAGEAASEAAQSTSTYSASTEDASASSRRAGSSARAASSGLGAFASGARRAAGAGSALSSVLIGLGVPAAVSGIGALIGSVVALSGALIGLVSSAGAAAGGLAALGPAALTAAGAIGTVTLAFRGVGEALKAATALEEQAASTASSAARQRAAAAKRIESAQYSLRQAQQAQARAAEDGARRIADAQRGVVDARRAAAEAARAAARAVEDAQERVVDANERVQQSLAELHVARQQAIRDLQQLSEQVSDNALSVEGAEIALIRARQRQAEVTADATSSALDRREAALRVAQAEDRLSDARRRARQDQAQLNEAERRGVEGSEVVRDAQRDLAEAYESRREAQEALARAEAEQTRTAEENARRIAEAQRGLAQARRQAARAQQDAAERVARAQQQLSDAMAASAVATGGASAAAQKYAAALAKLSPEGRRLVRVLRGLQPLLEQLSRTAQQAFFPGLIKAINILTPMIRSVAMPTVREFGQTLGWLALSGSRTFRSFEADLIRFGTGAGPRLLKNFGQMIINLIAVFEDLTMAAIPLTEWLSRLARAWSANLRATVNAKRATGELADIFRTIQEEMKVWGGIIKNTGSILFSVLQGAFPLGQRLARSIRNMTKETAEYLNTAEGQRKITKYFNDMEPTIRVLGRLFRDAFFFLTEMGASDATYKILKAVEDELGPALGRLLRAMAELAEEVGPAVVILFADLADALSEILEAGGGDFFSAFVETLGFFASVLREILEIPGVATLAGTLLAIAGGLKAIKAVGALTGMNKVAGGLSTMAGAAIARRRGELPPAGQTPLAPTTGFFGGAARGVRGASAAGRGTRAGAPTLRALAGERVGAAAGRPIRRAGRGVRDWWQRGPAPPAQGPGAMRAPAPSPMQMFRPAARPAGAPTRRTQVGGVLRRAGGAIGRGARAVGTTVGGGAAAIGGSLLGSRLGGAVGGTPGAIVGSVAGAAAPEALAAGFRKLSPLIDTVKGKLATLASTLSGAVAGGARRALGGMRRAASAAGSAAAAVGRVTVAYARVGAAAVASGAQQAAAWARARAAAAVGMLRSLGRVAMSYARVGTAAVVSGSKQAAAWVMARSSALAGLLMSLGRATVAYARLGAAAVLSATRMAVARTMVAASAATSRVATVALNLIRLGWLRAAMVAMISAARMAAAWLIALGPIGWVIAAIGAIVAAVIYAWNNFEWFRDVVIAVWNAIKTAAKWAWENVLKPVFMAFARVAKWLWNNALKPVFGWIEKGWNLLAKAFQIYWNSILKPVFNAVAAVARWLWNNVLKPVFGWIEQGWNLLVKAVKLYWRTILKPVWNAVQAAARFMWNSVLKPIFNAIKTAWNAMGDGIRWVWNNIIRPAWDALKRGIGLVRDSFRTAVDGIERIWNRIKAITRKPIEFVVNTVYNDGIRWAWNKIANLVSLPPLPEAHFQQGGPIDGDEGGRVPGTGVGDKVPILAEPGEFVVSKPVVKKWGIRNISRAHKAAAAGQFPGLEGMFQGDFNRRAFAEIEGYQQGGAIGYATRVARAQHGKPYIWGGAGPAGSDCSGFMSIITNALRMQNPPYGRLGTTSTFPWSGFAPGLAGFSIGNVPGSHMKGNLFGTNAESGGAHGFVAFGPPADGPPYGANYHLPRVGGEFIGGGAGGGGIFSFVTSAFDKVMDFIKQIYEKFGRTQWTTAATEMPKESAKGAISYIWDQVTGGISAFASSVGEAAQSFGGAVSDFFGFDRGGWLMPGTTVAVNNTGQPEAVIPDPVRAFTGSLAEVLREFLPDWVRANAAELRSVLGDRLSRLADRFGDRLAPLVERAREWLRSRSPEQRRDIADRIRDAVAELRERWPQFARAVGRRVREGLGRAREWLIEAVRNQDPRVMRVLRRIDDWIGRRPELWELARKLGWDSRAWNSALDPNRGKPGYVQAEDGSWVPRDEYYGGGSGGRGRMPDPFRDRFGDLFRHRYRVLVAVSSPTGRTNVHDISRDVARHASELIAPPWAADPNLASMASASASASRSTQVRRESSYEDRSRDITVNFDVSNPEPEPASDTASRKMRTLAQMGLFS